MTISAVKNLFPLFEYLHFSKESSGYVPVSGRKLEGPNNMCEEIWEGEKTRSLTLFSFLSLRFP